MKTKKQYEDSLKFVSIGLIGMIITILIYCIKNIF